MNELSFRAIFIGVVVFLVVLTITAILLYYNIAIKTATDLNKRTNIEFEYSKRIKNLFNKEILTGTDVRNIIRYYYLDERVNISITKIKAADTSTDTNYINVNNTWFVSSGVAPNRKVISEYEISRINPSYKGKIIKNEKIGNIQIINIELE